MIGDVFGKITAKFGQVVDAIAETGEDIIYSTGTATVPSTVTRTLPLPVQATILAAKTLGSVKSRSQQQTQFNEREQNMTAQMGNMPIELQAMRGQVGFEQPSQAFIGPLTNLGTNVVSNVLRNLRGPIGGVAGGVAGGLIGSMANGDQCGCQPKPFVRYNKCNEPIITRKMKKQAIEAINCNGPEIAAASLTGGDLILLNAIVSKQFPPQRRGISGAQLNNAAKTARRLDRMHTQFMKMCKPTTRRR